MTANYLLPAGTINNRTAYFYADTSKQFGPIIKKVSDQILVILDFTTILAGHVINTYNFTSDVETNPALYLTDPILNVTGTVLSFLISGGIDGQQYNITTATEVVGSTTPRYDILTVNMPSKSACDASIPPMVSLLGGSSIVTTNPRYFWGPNPPTGQHVMDEWFDTATNILYEWATDGINYFWEEIGINTSTGTGGYITDAASDNTLYSRRNATWVADPIQVDATSDGKIYVRNNDNWIPDPLQIDAPNDGQVYGRQNQQWALAGGGSGGGISDAPSDGNTYGRKNATWVVPKVGVVYVYPGQPPASQVLNVPITFNISVPANLAGSGVYASSPPSGTATFTLNKISGGVTTAIGMITINSGSQIASALSGSGGSLAVGDVLQMVAPSTSPILRSGVVTPLFTPPSGFNFWGSSTTTTFNPSDKSTNIVLSNSNTTVTTSDNTIGGTRTTTSHSSGKWYVEFIWTAPSGGATQCGIATGTETFANIGNFGTNAAVAEVEGTGWVWINGTRTSTQIGTIVAGDTICCAVDLTGSLIWFRVNNGIWNNSSTANPVTGVGGLSIVSVFPTNAAFAVVTLMNASLGVGVVNGTFSAPAPPPSGGPLADVSLTILVTRT